MSLKGMFSLEMFNGFSETNITRLEDELIRWTRKQVPNKVLFFEREALKLGETSNVDGSDFIYQVKLPRLCMEYICINAGMCILLKVTRTDGENNRIIYKIPNSWSGTSPWLSEEKD